MAMYPVVKPADERKTLSVAEAARLIEQSEEWIRAHILTGELEGGRYWENPDAKKRKYTFKINRAQFEEAYILGHKPETKLAEWEFGIC
jgi:hypothetical protein